MRRTWLLAAVLASGCGLLEPQPDLRAQLATETAERQRLERALREQEQATRAAEKREEALRQQLEALKSIERGILEREERLRSKAR